MKNTMQLKAVVKNFAKEKHISAQLVLQNYMLERFLERVSLSVYRDNFILKGGFLIASMVGLDSRATMDMDITKVFRQYRKIIETVRNSEVMNRQWNRYKKDFEYASEIAFGDTCDAVIRIMSGLFPNGI